MCLISFGCFSLCHIVRAQHVLPDQLLLFIPVSIVLQLVHAKHIFS